MKRLLRALRCHFGYCPGHVVSGIRYPFIYIGWQCNDCRVVKHYEPASYLPRRPHQS
jgi:hypothetical protein